MGPGKIISTLFIVFLFSFTLSAQMDIRALDQYIAQAQQDWDVPGLSLGIVKDGEVVLAKGYGTLETGKPGDADEKSLFAIASNTKAFISAAIGILVDEGKMNWDDPVVKHLPYFKLYDPFVTQHITVRDLLCHRAGLGTFSGDVIWYKSNYSAEETVKRAAQVPQAYDFRAGYGYSNLMFITAGEVIKAVSGQEWYAFVKDRIFDPLGMTRTRTSTDDLKMMKNVATPHKPSGDKNTPIAWANWDNMGAAGGIISSAEDMLKWIQLQLDEGKHNGKAIFSENAQANFWQAHNSHRVSKFANEQYRNRNFSAYGLGWGLTDYAGRKVTSHGGGYDGMYSRVILVPEEELGIVILTNSMKGISTYLSYQIMDSFMDVEPKDWSKIGLKGAARGVERRKKTLKERADARMEGTKPRLTPDGYAGKYSCNMYGDIEVKNSNGTLELHFAAAPLLEASLSHWHYDTYQINWKNTHAWFDFGTVQFILDNNGKAQELQFDVPNGDIFFEEIKAVKVK